MRRGTVGDELGTDDRTYRGGKVRDLQRRAPAVPRLSELPLGDGLLAPKDRHRHVLSWSTVAPRSGSLIRLRSTEIAPGSHAAPHQHLAESCERTRKARSCRTGLAGPGLATAGVEVKRQSWRTEC